MFESLVLYLMEFDDIGGAREAAALFCEIGVKGCSTYGNCRNRSFLRR
jgi:hypothetical protein